MKFVLLEFNKRTPNGRIFTPEEFHFDPAKEYLAILSTDTAHWASPSVPLDRVTHSVKNLRIEGNKLVGDVTLLTTRMGKILEIVAGDDYLLRVNGMGKQLESGHIMDFTLWTFLVETKE